MIASFVLLCLAALCVARSGFSGELDVPDHDPLFANGGPHHDEHDQHRDRRQRIHDKGVLGREIRRIKHKDERRERHDDDDDHAWNNDDSARIHHLGRLQNRIDRQIQDRIQETLKHAQVQTVFTQSYQLRCARNSTLGATNVNDTAVNRTVGPLLLVGKTSLADVTTDSFDGNNDGETDVLEAYNNWLNAQPATAATQAALIDKFILAQRNRATVNGGTIDLHSIVLTGRAQIVHKKKGTTTAGNFFTFGNSTILITPCFPLSTATDYNVDVYAAISDKGFNSTLLYTNLNASSFFTTSSAGIVWSEDEQISLPRRTGLAAGVVEAFCTLQFCTQHSYFHSN